MARAALLALAAGVSALLALTAQPAALTRASATYGLVKTYSNPAPAANAEFGNAVAWLPSGNEIAVGARSDLLGGVSAVGAVYILDRDSGAVTHVLSRTGASASDYFGFSLAVSGTKVLAGAPHDNAGVVTESGAAYLFDSVNGSLVQTFTNPVPINNDFFGFSVVVVSNTSVLIGVPRYDVLSPTVTNAGRAYLCDIASGLCPTAIDIPNPSSHDAAFFGSAVVSLADKFAIGAPLDTFSHGKVYVYTTTTGTLYHTIAPTTTASGDYFGGTLAVVNGNLLIGAQYTADGSNANSGAAYLYQPDGTLLHIFYNPAPENDAYFGEALAADGNFVLIGAPGAANQSGLAFLYDATTYQLISTFRKDSPSANDEFGSAVGVFGENFIFGAPNDNQGASRAGAVYRFGVKTRWDAYLPIVTK